MAETLRALLMGDIFSGIGCASWVFKRRGHQPKFALDIDSERSDLYRVNIGVKPIVADVRRVDGDTLLASSGLKKGELDILVSCPPCQPFSSLSRTRRIKTSEDARSSLILESGRLIEQILPRAILLENVSGLDGPRGRQFFDLYLAKMHNLGYITVRGTLGASNYGVPQFRRRVFAISVKCGEVKDKPSLPPPTHFGEGRRPHRKTVRAAIGSLPPLAPGETSAGDPFHAAALHLPKTLEIIGSIPIDGGSRRSLPKELVLPCHRRLAKGAESVYGRMWWDRPSPTITTRCLRPSCGRFIHPDQNRGITPREAARLQSIPDEFYLGRSLDGRRDSVAAMIGDSVPPTLMMSVCAHIERLLN